MRSEYPIVLAAVRKHDKLRRKTKRALGDELFALCGPTAPAERSDEELSYIRVLGLRRVRESEHWRYDAYFKEQNVLRRSFRQLHDEVSIGYQLDLNNFKEALADARQRVASK